MSKGIAKFMYIPTKEANGKHIQSRFMIPLTPKQEPRLSFLEVLDYLARQRIMPNSFKCT
jgi:hypothetical protein